VKSVACVLLLLLLTGCGKAGTSPAAAPAPPQPSEIASRFGCVGFAPETTQELYVSEVGRCTLGQDTAVRVLTFHDDTGRDAFVKIAASFGPSYAVGDMFVVEGTSTTVDTVDSKLGTTRA